MFLDCTDLPVWDYFCAPEKLSTSGRNHPCMYQWYFSKELPRVLFKILVGKYLLLSCAPPQLALQGDAYSRDFLLRADGCSVEERISNLLIFFEMFCTDEGPKDCSSL